MHLCTSHRLMAAPDEMFRGSGRGWALVQPSSPGGSPLRNAPRSRFAWLRPGPLVPTLPVDPGACLLDNRQSASNRGSTVVTYLSMRTLAALLALVSVVLPPVALAQSTASAQPTKSQLSAQEQTIVRVAASRYEHDVALLERTVNINSGTLNLDGVREVGRVFRDQFDQLGFQTEWIDGTDFDRAGHLVARHGQGPLHVLLIGHLDTVFEPDHPFQRYEQIDEFHAKGPGTTDMKGGNIVILSALAALLEAGAFEGLTVTVVLIGDEEKVGAPVELARHVLIEAAKQADIALGFEDGDGDPTTAVVARRGSTSWTLEVSGRTAHSSQIFQPDVGAGAVFEMARILQGFRHGLAYEQNLTFNPGLVVGGTSAQASSESARGEAFGKNNVIAETATVMGDLRALSLEQLERAKGVMQAVVQQSLPHTHAQLTFFDKYPPLAPAPGNYELLKVLDRASRDLGHGPVTAVDPRRAGAADVSFTAGLVEGALDGLGLMGSGGHTDRETADLRTFTTQAQRVALLLLRLAQSHGK